MEMFNSEFNEITKNFDDYLKPKFTFSKRHDGNLKDFNDFCVGIYKIPMAPTIEQSNLAFHAFFKSCDELDKILGERFLKNERFLNGDELSICDLKIFSTLIRFDVAYYFLYRANLKRMQDYKNIFKWLQCVYNFKGIFETVFFEDVKKLYWGNKEHNPSGRVPIGPEIGVKKCE